MYGVVTALLVFEIAALYRLIRNPIKWLKIPFIASQITVIVLLWYNLWIHYQLKDMYKPKPGTTTIVWPNDTINNFSIKLNDSTYSVFNIPDSLDRSEILYAPE